VKGKIPVFSMPWCMGHWQ